MDVQVLEMSNGLHDLPGIPGIRRPAPRRPAVATPSGGGHATATNHRPWLLAYTAVSIVAGMAAFLWSTMTVPIRPAINPGLEGTALGGADGGLLLWIAFGLVGSLRVLPIPGGSGVWTFHMPFIAAAMVLGGPTAGAWVGFLSTIERRELDTQPWYGALANHSVMAFAAVAGGLTVQVTKGALSSAGAETAVASLAATTIGTLVLAAVGNGVAAGTIMLRERLSALSLLEILVRSFGGITIAEIGLAWVFVTLYGTTGWWAPLALAVIVLLVWPGEGVEFKDPLTKLPRDGEFRRMLDGVLARSRRGLADGGLLVLFDLDGFGQLNKDHGQHIGDEVLREIGNRVRADIRSTDFAGRRGGDEFAVFYAAVPDSATAHRIGRRLEAAIRRPISTSAGTMYVGVSIGALIVRPATELPPTATLMEWADAEVQVIKKLQKEGRSTTGIRFHEYGLQGAKQEQAAGGNEAARGATALPGAEPLVNRAARMGALALLLMITAWTLSRFIPA